MGSPERRLWQLHYCGACKTIGRQYGHKSRMLLNYDAVFLAELLTELGGEDAEAWAVRICLAIASGFQREVRCR